MMEPWYNKWSSDIQARRQQLENNIEKLNVLQCHSHFRKKSKKIENKYLIICKGKFVAYIIEITCLFLNQLFSLCDYRHNTPFYYREKTGYLG